jgi:glycosyltransferase involved in cell wall biosynthesis
LKVSIITVTYNSEKYLADCIESVKKQTYGDIEHIIIDGKSTDNTLKIIHKYSAHIASWMSESDRGIYDAINKGMRMATGDIIGVLNSDDMLASADVIMDIVALFDESGTDAVYGDLAFVHPVNTQKLLRFWKGLPYKRSRFKFGWMPAHPTFYIRRDLVSRYGEYENHYITAADYEFMARYLYQHKVKACYLPKTIVKMRTGGASNSSLYKRLRANRRDYLAMKRNGIPFAFFVSILKPISKIPQFKRAWGHKIINPDNFDMHYSISVSFFPAERKTGADV